MNFKTMNLLALLRKTGFGLGFVLGGLFIGAVALWTPQAHAHDFKQGDLVIDHPYATPSLAGTRNGSVYFKGLRNRASSHPNLNDRLANMVGQHGQATVAFEGGSGKVKIGDTVWLARADGAINPGDGVTVTGAEQGVLRVRVS